MIINRRTALVLAAGGFLAACGSTPYVSQGPANLIMRVEAAENGIFVARDIYMGVHTGTMDTELEYLGSVDFAETDQRIGLPQGVPLVLGVEFYESSFWASGSTSSTIPVEVPPIHPGQMYMLTVAYDQIGFSHDLKRIR